MTVVVPGGLLHGAGPRVFAVRSRRRGHVECCGNLLDNGSMYEGIYADMPSWRRGKEKTRETVCNEPVTGLSHRPAHQLRFEKKKGQARRTGAMCVWVGLGAAESPSRSSDFRILASHITLNGEMDRLW